MARLSREWILLFIVCGMLLSVFWRQQPLDVIEVSTVSHVKVDSVPLELELIDGIDSEIAGWSSQIQQGLTQIASTQQVKEEIVGRKRQVESSYIPKQQMTNIAKPIKPSIKQNSYIRHTGDGPSALVPSGQGEKRRLTFIKTYKTGSTTMAMFINSISYQLNLKMLQPLDSGWFKEGEIMSRAKRGSYDVSYRHLSPNLEYTAMNALLPNCIFGTTNPPSTRPSSHCVHIIHLSCIHLSYISLSQCQFCVNQSPASYHSSTL